MSVIARTAGIGRTPEELQWDLNYLLQLWRAIEDAAQPCKRGAFLIYQESSLVIRAIRDYFHPDIGEILIDTEAIYEQAQQFMGHVMPDNVQPREALHGRRPAVLALPDRAPDRDRVRAPGAAALGRRDRDRPHRGAGLGRRQLGARHQGRRHREDRVQHQPRSRRRDRAPAAPARPGRPDRHRLHRHGERSEPARGREPPARRAAVRPRARADRQDLALRPDGAVAPAAAALARRDQRTSPARAATASATSAAPNRPRCTSCASSRKRR